MRFSSEGMRGQPVPVRFYLMAILFILFDVELAFLFPGQSCTGASDGSVCEMFIFFLVVGQVSCTRGRLALWNGVNSQAQDAPASPICWKWCVRPLRTRWRRSLHCWVKHSDHSPGISPKRHGIAEAGSALSIRTTCRYHGGGLRVAEAALRGCVPLLSLAKNLRLRIKIRVDAKDPVVDSVTALWGSANWLEREVWTCSGYGSRPSGSQTYSALRGLRRAPAPQRLSDAKTATLDRPKI